MSEHKDKWYEPYKIVTTLDKMEIVRRIESKTAFIASKYDGSIDDLLFYSAKKYYGEYRGYRGYIYRLAKYRPLPDNKFFYLRLL